MSASAVSIGSLATGVEWINDQGLVRLGTNRQIYVYERGTTSEVPVYQDEGLSSPLTQPLTTNLETGTVPGYVASGQSLDLLDVASGATAQAEALAAQDVIGSDGTIGSGKLPVSGTAIASAGGLLTTGSLTSGNLLGANSSGEAADAGIASSSVENAVSLQLTVGAPSGDTTGATDTTAIQDALNTANANGGGVVRLEAGTYWVQMQAVPNFSGYYAGLMIGAYCHLVGAGMDATTIKLAADQADGGPIISNPGLDGSAKDTSGSLRDLTVDGNGANQTVLGGGVNWTRAQAYRRINLRVRNVYGTADTSPGETFHISSTYGADHVDADCIAIGTAGTQGSGFATNGSTNCIRIACVADSMSAGMGFTDYQSTGIINAGCIARRCGANGFNSEGSTVIYNGCVGGAIAADVDTDDFPFTPGASLGNDDNGFCCNSSTNGGSLCIYNGCYGISNTTGHGLTVTGGSTAVINGGAYGAGIGTSSLSIYFNSATDATNSRLSATTQLLKNPNNGAYRLNIASLGQVQGGLNGYPLLPAPTVPASGTAIANPFPFAVDIALSATITSVKYSNGGYTITPPQRFSVPAGETITLTYSSAPTWSWTPAY